MPTQQVAGDEQAQVDSRVGGFVDAVHLAGLEQPGERAALVAVGSGLGPDESFNERNGAGDLPALGGWAVCVRVEKGAHGAPFHRAETDGIDVGAAMAGADREALGYRRRSGDRLVAHAGAAGQQGGDRGQDKPRCRAPQGRFGRVGG